MSIKFGSKNGGRVYKGESGIERMMSRTIPVPESGCWIHLGKKVGDGYSTEPNGVRAHRAFYQTFVGEIPAGKVVAHMCDVPCCVNPAHLFVCSQAENIADKVKKGRQAKGEGMAFAKLTESDVVEIKTELRLPYFGIYTDLGRRFGVHRSVIKRIKNGVAWRHVN